MLARDTAGRVSWASPPLTFATGSPSASTCTVRFSANNDWGNGYIGGVEIINNGPNPINGWTLTWTWPTGWQQVEQRLERQLGAGRHRGGGSQPDHRNRQIAAGGGTVSAGFVGAYGGPNVLPTAFSLNGTVCATG